MGDGNANCFHSAARAVKSDRFSITSILDMGLPSHAANKHVFRHRERIAHSNGEVKYFLALLFFVL